MPPRLLLSLSLPRSIPIPFPFTLPLPLLPTSQTQIRTAKIPRKRLLRERNRTNRSSTPYEFNSNPDFDFYFDFDPNPRPRASASNSILKNPVPPSNNSNSNLDPSQPPPPATDTQFSIRRLPSHRELVRRGSKAITVEQHATKMSLDALARYSPPDVSDALMKLFPSDGVHRGGYIPDVIPRTGSGTPRRVVGLASTMLFGSKVPAPPHFTPYPWTTSKSEYTSTPDPESQHAIPKNEQWSDLVPSGRILLIDQPGWHTCACIGGHHISRLAQLGVRGLVVSGRIRDVAQAKESGLPVWSSGLSTVGAGAETVPLALGADVTVMGMRVSEGWVVMADEEEGVVAFDGGEGRLEQVLEFLEGHVEVEGRVSEAIQQGKSVQEAFRLRLKSQIK